MSGGTCRGERKGWGNGPEGEGNRSANKNGNKNDEVKKILPAGGNGKNKKAQTGKKSVDGQHRIEPQERRREKRGSKQVGRKPARPDRGQRGGV